LYTSPSHNFQKLPILIKWKRAVDSGPNRLLCVNVWPAETNVVGHTVNGTEVYLYIEKRSAFACYLSLNCVFFSMATPDPGRKQIINRETILSYRRTYGPEHCGAMDTIAFD
jgi:hypothetical protein